MPGGSVSAASKAAWLALAGVTASAYLIWLRPRQLRWGRRMRRSAWGVRVRAASCPNIRSRGPALWYR